MTVRNGGRERPRSTRNTAGSDSSEPLLSELTLAVGRSFAQRSVLASERHRPSSPMRHRPHFTLPLSILLSFGLSWLGADLAPLDRVPPFSATWPMGFHTSAHTCATTLYYIYLCMLLIQVRTPTGPADLCMAVSVDQGRGRCCPTPC